MREIIASILDEEDECLIQAVEMVVVIYCFAAVDKNCSYGIVTV